MTRRTKATPEHPFLVRRSDERGFASAEILKPGDYLIGERLAWDRVQIVGFVDALARTVAVQLPGQCVVGQGVWVHSDMAAMAKSSGSESSSSGSGSMSGSGSGSGSGKRSSTSGGGTGTS